MLGLKSPCYHSSRIHSCLPVFALAAPTADVWPTMKMKLCIFANSSADKWARVNEVGVSMSTPSHGESVPHASFTVQRFCPFFGHIY